MRDRPSSRDIFDRSVPLVRPAMMKNRSFVVTCIMRTTHLVNPMLVAHIVRPFSTSLKLPFLIGDHPSCKTISDERPPLLKDHFLMIDDPPFVKQYSMGDHHSCKTISDETTPAVKPFLMQSSRSKDYF